MLISLQWMEMSTKLYNVYKTVPKRDEGRKDT